MNITYDYYRIFYYVAKYNSFSQAAKILMNSQPNISRSINNLENQLECSLFIRSNRGVRLTPEGEKLYRHVAVAFEQIHNAELELFSEKNLQNGSIAIGASEAALHNFLLTKLNQFHQSYPGIRIRVLNHTMPQALEALKNGLIDLAVVAAPTNLGKNYQAVPLKHYQEILICSAQHTSLIEGQHHLKELTEYPIICLGKESGTYHFYSRLFLEYNLHLHPDIEVGTTDLILPMIKNNLGIGFVPRNFAEHAIKRKEVYPVSLIEEIPERTICLIKDIGRPLTIAASQFEKLLYS